MADVLDWVVGAVVGVALGVVTHVVLLPNIVLSATLCGLYAIGVALTVDHVRVLGKLGDNGGSWWVIAFGGVVGLALIGMQVIYQPIIPSGMVGTDAPLPVPSENVATIPLELSIPLWLLMAGVALVSLNFGIGLALADATDR